jgi:peptidoglycan/LPS O-acetylase OafA/YrhL
VAARADLFQLLLLPTSKLRSDGIDLERAALAIWVLFSHLMPWANAAGVGDVWLGRFMRAADLFFQSSNETHPAVLGFIVLSGYCIHRNGFRKTGGSASAYAIRRFFRIWPVYFLATIVGVVAFLLASSLSRDLAVLMTLSAEISSLCLAVKLTGVSAFLPSLHECSFQGNGPLTTVMVEMWLYALYAAAIFLVVRPYGEKILLGPIVLVWLAGVHYVFNDPSAASWWHNGSLVGFALYWWLGALFVNEQFQKMIWRIRYGLFLLWTILTAVLVAKLSVAFPLVEARKVVTALIFGMVTVAIDNRRVRLLSVFSHLGKAGYSIYAFHAPILAFLLIAGAPWWVVAISAITAGVVIFGIYEDPLIRYGKRIAQKTGQPLPGDATSG